MKRSSVRRAQSNNALRATDTTHSASPMLAMSESIASESNSSIRTPRRAKSSPKLCQQAAAATEPTPPLPPPSKGTYRISGFASKFRLFKARRTNSASSFIDGLPPSSSSTLTKLTAPQEGLPLPNFNSDMRIVYEDPVASRPSPSSLGSRLRKVSSATTVQAHARYHRANTAPSATRAGTQNEDSLVGLGIVDLRFDARTGKYGFPSDGLFPGGCDMERSRSSSAASSTEESGGPTTPTESIPSIPGSVGLDKTCVRESIDEAGCQEVIGVLGSLFPSKGDDTELSHPALDMTVAEGCSPILRPVDSPSSMHARSHHHQTISSSTAKDEPISHQSLPTRSSSLRDGMLDTRNGTLKITAAN